MQDKTINNALLALYRSGEAREHVEALMMLRGVDKPQRIHDRPLSRGRCKRIVLSLLPCATSDVANVIQSELDGVSRKSAVHRAYMALCRLRDSGRVVQDFGPDGCFWRVSDYRRS